MEDGKMKIFVGIEYFQVIFFFYLYSIVSIINNDNYFKVIIVNKGYI